MKHQHIVITGGSGRLGRYVVERLRHGRSLTVVDLQPCAVPGVAYQGIGITDLPALRDAFQGADAVVHLAAVPNPRTTTPALCFSTNTQGTWTTLQAAEDAGVKRVIVISSDSATGLHFNPENWSPHYLPVDEQHPLRPTEVYSLSKEVTEAIARCFAARGKLEVLAIRPSHVVFEPEYPELEARGTDLQNYHLWGYVAPEDVAQSIELALDHDDGRYDCFFIAAEDGLNRRPTLDLLRERFGALPEIRRPELYQRMPIAGVFDITHAKEKLGYVPRYTWRNMKPAC